VKHGRFSIGKLENFHGLTMHGDMQLSEETGPKW